MTNEEKISLIIFRDIDNKYKVNLFRSSHPSTLPMPPSNWLKNTNI
jgi:hypothetical protein